MKKILSHQFIRFLLVGVLNTITGLSSIFILYNCLLFNYWVATSVGNLIGGICSYFLNKKFTFNSTKSFKSSAMKFIFVNICAYLISYYIGYCLISFIKELGIKLNSKVYENLSILFASGLFTIFNYIGHKYITFAEKNTTK